MSIVMGIKKVLRHFGVDIITYHSFWDDIARPREYKTVLDIGASDGSSARILREYFPTAEIHSFEPLKSSYEKLLRNMAGDKRFHAYNMALGEREEETEIYHSDSEASSSLLSMASLHKVLYPGSATHTKERISVRQLDTILSGTDLEKPLLVKIDVQGFENRVIRGGAKTLREADTIVIENSFVTLYENQALFGEIHTLLQSLGFSYHGRSETHYNQKTKESIYEDSIFIKDEPR